MAVPILLPIIGYSVLSVLVSYVAIRLYRSRGDVLPIPVSSFKLGRATSSWWDCRKSLTWTWPTSQKKAKPSKHTTVHLLPITGLPPPPTALPTPPLVDVSSASIPSPPTSFSPHKNKIHSLLPTSFSRPPSPHALFTTTVLQKPRRSRSLGGVPVRRLSGGASGLRNVQFLDLDVEMQEMDRDTSREHLLIDFSSSGSSDELDPLRRENEEDGILSRRISPTSSDIGIVPFHHRPSFSDDAEAPLVDLAPGRKVLPLVDLDGVEDGLGVKQKEEDTRKWFVPTLFGKIPESTPATLATPISKSISEPLPTTLLSLAMSEGKLIDLHTELDQEHVLVDLDVQDDNNVPQHREFVPVHTTRVDLDAAVTKAAVPLDNPIAIINSTTSDLSGLEESNQRGRRVDRHPLKDIEKAEGTVEDKEQNNQALVNKHELYDHHDAYDKLQRHSSQPLDTIRASSLSLQLATIPVQAAPVCWDREDDPWNRAVGVGDGEGEHDVEEALSGENEVTEEHAGKVEEDHEKEVDLMEAGLEVEDVVKVSSTPELAVERSLEEVPTEKVEDDEKGVDLMEAGLEVGKDEVLGEISSALELPVESSPEEVPTEKVEEEDQKGVDLMDAGLEDGKDENFTNMSSELEFPVESYLEEVPSEMEDDQSYPDPDYLPLPQLLLGSSNILIEQHGLPDSFQEDGKNQGDDQQQQFKDDESSIRATIQMPTPPASPPASPLHVKGLMRSGPPSPNSLPPLALSPLSTSQSTSPKLALSLVLTPNTASLFPAIEKIKVENTEVDKENESPNSATCRPLWSIRADDAPALGLAASSLSTTSSDGLIPGVGTNIGVSPRMRRRVLGDVTTVVENEEKEKHMLKEEKEEDDEESSLPGAFPELVKTSDIIAPTITVAALTSTLLSTSIAAASSSITTPLSASTPLIKRRPITRSPLDIALAMQLRPGLGVGADPAWMVRFLMAMFGWFAILVSGQGEF